MGYVKAGWYNPCKQPKEMFKRYFVLSLEVLAPHTPLVVPKRPPWILTLSMVTMEVGKLAG